MLLIFISLLLALTPLSESQEIDRDGILDKINSVRETGCSCKGKKMPPVPPLKWSETLEKTAYLHAKDMDERDYFSHVTPDGTDVGQRVNAAGYDWSYVGENIALGQKHFDQVFEDWIKSPVHCKLIMSPNFTETAVAKYGQKWVQHFGRRME